MNHDPVTHGPIIVFLGPTLALGEAQQNLDAIYLPPAAQGSVIRAVERFRPSAILLIDGSFQSEPAVRHKELLWALSRGIRVVGTASMGALRAAELCRYGMEGVGLIFRWYRRCQFAPDDAVAVLHGPSEVNCSPLTQALVDLRMSFRLAERHGHIDVNLRQRLDFAAAQLNFRDRTMDHVVRHAMQADTCPDAEMHVRLVRKLEACFTSQKARDARLALQKLGAWQPERVQAPAPFTATQAFVADLEAAGIEPQMLANVSEVNPVS